MPDDAAGDRHGVEEATVGQFECIEPGAKQPDQLRWDVVDRILPEDPPSAAAIQPVRVDQHRHQRPDEERESSCPLNQQVSQHGRRVVGEHPTREGGYTRRVERPDVQLREHAGPAQRCQQHVQCFAGLTATKDDQEEEAAVHQATNDVMRSIAREAGSAQWMSSTTSRTGC